MKLKYIAGLMLSAGLVMTSCSDFTDIDAKGNNLLSSVNDLEMLLNSPIGYDYYQGIDMSVRDMSEICGDYIYSYSLLSTSINVPVKTANSIRLTYDEAAWLTDMPILIKSDNFYSSCYYYIGRVANPILMQIDGASGDESKKDALKAEAYLVRAYFHWLACQKFAPVYNPSTASSTIALAYFTEDMDIKTPAEPLTMEAFYAKINADIDAAIALDALPDNAINQMRLNRAAMYAIQAVVLTSMQKFDEAAAAADKALAVNNTVSDYTQSMITTKIRKTDESPLEDYQQFVRPRLEMEEDYFTTYGYISYNNITPYAQSFIEPGHVYLLHLNCSSLGRDESEKDRISTNRLGEPGYIIPSSDLSQWYPMFGLRSSQMYLIKAENAVRNGNYDEAMGYLDIVREKRIMPEYYAPLKGTVNDKATAIKYLKMSYETEGLFSVWNYINRKRWNVLDSDWQETITRTIDGRSFTLNPDSKMWVFPIPQTVTNLNPNFKPFMND
ncbi:MAG: RagB/SusD family nutrient uptake outer membrane protein [Bacteroides sp.]|nr:RagB/SusD family nutrient uptake outer membrane protein [Bacteroides sp.]